MALRTISAATAFLMLTSCAQDNPNCTDGCVDVCKPQSQSCVSDYNQGHALGYRDGVCDRLTDGVNSDPYVAGYWDGIADGKADRAAGVRC